MEKQTYTFKIKFSVKIILLCAAILLLCTVGIALSLYRALHYGIHGVNDVIKYPFLILVCVFCIALVVAVLCKSVYVVNKDEFITKFGFIKTKYPVKALTAIVLDRDKNKITLYMGEDYAILSVNEDWTDALVRALLEMNPDIDYTYTLKEDTTKSE